MKKTEIDMAMIAQFEQHFLGGASIPSPKSSITSESNIINAVRTISSPGYWTRPNTVEAIGFATKIAIIFPGLLFGKQWWWLYIFAIISSASLIWSSTKKTLPTIILFNVAWVILASLSIAKHFLLN
jgi:hypothetical protein